MTSSEMPARDQALALLAEFCRRILPCTLRRIARWRRIPTPTMADLGDDVRQELAIDCLENTAAVLGLSAEQRHSRWMRKADQWIYRQRRQYRQRSELPPGIPAPPVAATATTAAQPEIVSLANGRMNVVASASRAGTAPRRLRRQMEAFARQLGCDDEYLRFWRRRLAEAMTGLAADLMRTQSDLRLLGSRPAPHPDARLLRLRRVAAYFQVRPSTKAVRRLLQPWLRRFEDHADAPRRLLEHAVLLAPGNSAAWLWLFEACCAAWDLPAAAEALRSCRQQATPCRSALTLARARLLEVRENWPAAINLLRRARRRWPFEGKLRQVLVMLDHGAAAAQG